MDARLYAGLYLPFLFPSNYELVCVFMFVLGKFPVISGIRRLWTLENLLIEMRGGIGKNYFLAFCNFYVCI